MPNTLKESKEIFTTPPKKQLRSLELEKAAYKENPFRDLAKKWMINIDLIFAINKFDFQTLNSKYKTQWIC